MSGQNSPTSWVEKLIVCTGRHEAKEVSVTKEAGSAYHYSRKSVSIPAGSIVMVLKGNGRNVNFMFGENTWESDKSNFEICAPTTALQGKTFCFTGALSKSRDYWEAYVTLHGGEFRKTVTLDLGYLVMAYKNSFSRKAQMARSKGIQCLEEDDLVKLVATSLAAQSATPAP